ncbi:MAG: GNAT family N-acetyltransferase [Pseudomonadota bacterium]
MIALHEGAAIGGRVAYALEKREKEPAATYLYDLAILYDLAVAAAHRRRGGVTALLKALRRGARGQCAAVIFVHADYADPPAIAPHERFGAREEILHFDIAADREIAQTNS